MNPGEKSRRPEPQQDVPVGRTENVRGGTARAPRFAVELPVHYRASQAGDWREGRTANVSRTGLLFEAEGPLEPNSIVEISLKMPVPVIQQVEASVVCMGRIVRVISPPDAGQRPEVAASIVSYYFVREKAVPDA